MSEFPSNTQQVVQIKINTIAPMTRGDYNDYRGWTLPADEDGSDEGYIVKYKDGYISWSPKAQMDESCVGNFSFGAAITMLKQGYKVARKGWNGKGMFLFLVNGSTFKVNRAPLLGIYPEGTEINYNPHVDMCTADGSIVPWLCSQTDMLAEDWELVQ